MGTDSNRIATDSREYWLKENIIPVFGKFIRLSTTGGSGTDDYPQEKPELEASDKLLTIIKERIRSTQETLISAVVDNPDFLPLSFLQTGAKRSVAVCRIVRNFSLQGFKELIEEIQKFKDIRNFDSVEKLKEIFSIPNQVADEIFKQELPCLKALTQISEEQLAKLNPIPIGTGFLVGGTHLLTNQHVLPTQEVAEQCIAQFNYVDEVIGARSIDYEFDPKVLFIANPDLDYTLVQLKSGMFTMPAGYNFGWIQLIEDDANIACELDEIQIERLKDDADFTKEQLKSYGLTEKVTLPGDAVIIIQHPKGRRKQITLANNTVKSLYKKFLRYTADSDYGSSGSPVFNNKWELVALHHAAIAKEENSQVKIVAQQGVRTCRIVEDLKKKSFSDSKLRSFIEDFVITSEQLNYPPFPSGLEFDGVGSYVSLDSSIGFSTVSEAFFPSEDSTVKFWSRGGVELRSLKMPTDSSKINFSSDGQTFACNLDDTLKLWRFDGTELKTLQGNGSPLQSVSFSPDGKTIAASTSDVLLIWKVDGGNTEIFKTVPEESSIFRFSPDSQMIATVGDDGKTVKLWSLEGILLQTFKAHTHAIRDINFSPNSKILASANEDKTIKLWNIVTGEELATLKGHSKAVISTSFSPDGKRIASVSTDNAVILWSKNGTLPKLLSKPFHKEEANYEVRISFSSDSRTLAAIFHTDADLTWDTIDSWNIAEGQKITQNKSIEPFRTDGNINFYPDCHPEHQIVAFREIDTNTNTIDINFLNLHNSKSVILKNAGRLITFFCDKTQHLNIDAQHLQNSSQSFSIEAWVNPYPDGKGGTIIQALPSWFFDADIEGIEGGKPLHIYINEKKMVRIGDIYDENMDEQGLTLTFGKFSHIVVTYDGHYIIVYINGYEKLNIKNEKNIKIDFLCPNFNAVSIPFLLGSSTSFASYYSNNYTDSNKYNYIQKDFFKGIIADVRLWKTARTKDEINADMHRRLSGNEEGLIGYWRFEEGEGDKVYNLASKGDYGIVCGAKWLRASQFLASPLPCGLKFSEEKDRIDCGNDESLNIDDNEAITVEVWVKHKFGNGLIIDRVDENGNGYSLSWYEGKIRVALQGESSAEKTVIDTKDNAPSDCVWHHIAFTWDKNSKEIAIYIDGRREDSVVIEGKSKSIVFQGQYKSIGLFEGSISHLTANLIIGARDENKSYFNVAIADVRLWKVARTQDELKVNMSRRLKGDENGLIGYWRLDDGGERNNQVRNLASDNNHGTVYGAKWFPAPPSTLQDSPK